MHVHQLPVAAALASLHSGPGGLATTEAMRRLGQFGPNRIARAARTPRSLRLLRECTHFFALVLWIAAALAFVADLIDPGHGMRALAVAVVAVILVNGLFSFWQEDRAEEAFQALQELLPDVVAVLRDGAARTVAAETLVPGDIVLLETGDNIPADCRVIQAFALRVNTSTVTGEAHPVARVADPAPEPDPLHNRNTLLAGTSVAGGSGRALVVATGMHTEFGRIARLAQGTVETPSPLQRELLRLSHVVAGLAVAAGALVFVIGEWLGLSRWANVVFAVGVIVANVPEGLLPTVTLALAMASRRLAKRNVLVRRLSSVETLGAASVICTDKTGTLTENRMTAQALYRLGEMVAPTAALTDGSRRLFECARRCHDLKDTGRADARWLGDPMEIALVEMALPSVADGGEKLDEVPFDSDRKRLVTVYRTDAGVVLYAKGALDVLLPACRWVATGDGRQPLGAAERERFAAAQTSLALQGLRVLALAHRELPERYDPADLEEDLVLDGLVGLEDPPRPEVPAAIARCRGAGIRVVMVTGDHPDTSVAIGRQIGLFAGAAPLVVTGEQLRHLSDSQLWACLDAPDVLFARVAADQKLRIVTALQRHGAIVAATGDGVNDAPALRAADIGVAMGQTGTDVARQAADMVLLDDNFANIVHAIEEGRGVYDNIRRFLTYILTSNVPELVPYLAFAFFNVPLPLTVQQILAVDLGTDMVPALGLGAEPAEPRVMARPPRRPTARVVTPALLVRAYLFLGPLEAIAAMSAFVFVHAYAGYAAGTTACLDAIILMQVANVYLCRRDRPGMFDSWRGANRLIGWGVGLELVLMFLITYTPAGQAVFGTAPLDARAWLFMLPFPAAMVVVEQLRRRIAEGHRRPRHQRPLTGTSIADSAVIDQR